MICTFFHMMNVFCACVEMHLGVEGLIRAIIQHLPTPVVIWLLTALPGDDWCYVAACRFDSQINYTHNECLQHEIGEWPVHTRIEGWKTREIVWLSWP
jgi:hypothetical protein